MILSLKKTFALGLVAALLGVMTVYGMSLFVAKRTIASTPVTVSTVWQAWQLNMTLEKTEFNRDENISVTLSLKNIGSTNETFIFPDYTALNFVVYDLNGTEIFNYQYGLVHPIGFYKVEFVPGQQLTYTFVWNPIGYWLAFGMRFPLYIGRSIPPGSYNIIGYSDDRDATRSKIATPQVAMTIKP